MGRSRWPCGLRCRSAAAWLLGFRLRSPLRAWMFVSCLCCMLCRLRPLERADRSFRGVRPCVCVCLMVCDQKPQKWGGLDPSWAVAPQKNVNNIYKEPGKGSWWTKLTTAWTTEESWFDSRQELDFYVFSVISRPSLWPTEPAGYNGRDMRLKMSETTPLLPILACTYTFISNIRGKMWPVHNTPCFLLLKTRATNSGAMYVWSSFVLHICVRN
jgi:hypothetical protein